MFPLSCYTTASRRINEEVTRENRPYPVWGILQYVQSSSCRLESHKNIKFSFLFPGSVAAGGRSEILAASQSQNVSWPRHNAQNKPDSNYRYQENPELIKITVLQSPKNTKTYIAEKQSYASNRKPFHFQSKDHCSTTLKGVFCNRNFCHQA